MKKWGFFCLCALSFLVVQNIAFASPITPGSFSTTWRTDNAGPSNDDQVTIPTSGGGYNYDIYWEEVGNDTNNGSSTGNTGDTTITFPVAGTYRVDITGSFPHLYSNCGGDVEKLLTVEQWGDIAWVDMAWAFCEAINLTVPAVDAPDLSGATSLEGMFANAVSFNQPVNHWDTSLITDMASLFSGATSFNQPLNSWDVGNVSSMGGAVEGCHGIFTDATSFNQPLNSWDVGNVNNFGCMFSGATSFNQPLNNWDVSGASAADNMFDGATSFNQDISSWDVSNISYARRMFRDSALSATNYTNILNAWSQLTLQNGVYLYTVGSTSAPTQYLFSAQAARNILTSTYSWTITDGGIFVEPGSQTFITVWDTTLDPSTPNELSIYASGGSSYNFYIDWGDGTVEHYPTAPGNIYHTYSTPGEKTVTFTGTFPYFYGGGDDGAEYNKLIDVAQWGTTVWEDLDFYRSTYLEGFSATDVPNTSAITDMSYMFSEATSFNDDLSAWNVSSATNMDDMFSGTAISILNYSKLLLAWSQQTVQDGVGLGLIGPTGEGSIITSYCSTVQSARDTLTTTYNWSIIDGGPVTCYTLSYTPGTNASLIGIGTQTYTASGTAGTQVTVVPDTGYRFVKWSDESTANPRTDTGVTANISVTAILESTGSGTQTSSKRSTGSISSSQMATLMDRVQDLVAYIQDNQINIATLSPEDKQRFATLLQSIVAFLLVLLGEMG